MQYVMERDGTAVIGPTKWSDVLQAATGLRGNRNPPTMPYTTSGGTLRAVVREVVGPLQRPSTGTVSGDVWLIAVEDLPLYEAKVKARQDLATKRYEVETGGMLVGEIQVATDRDTQAKLIAVRILAKEDANYTVTWKGPAGFVTLDASTIILVADAVSAHVQAAFVKEAELTALIEAAETVAEVRAINIETGWSA